MKKKGKVILGRSEVGAEKIDRNRSTSNVLGTGLNVKCSEKGGKKKMRLKAYVRDRLCMVTKQAMTFGFYSKDPVKNHRRA